MARQQALPERPPPSSAMAHPPARPSPSRRAPRRRLFRRRPIKMGFIDDSATRRSSIRSAGFVSFFSVLGYGYLDLFHTFIAASMFQLFVQVIVRDVGPDRAPPAPVWDDDRNFRRFLWGQLLFVVQGVGLVLAGVTITTIGASLVFVPEDLAFLGMSRAAIESLHPYLVPLIAHDRDAAALLWPAQTFGRPYGRSRRSRDEGRAF